MSKINKIRITTGVYWVSVPETGLYVLCGCPADSVKHLIKMGLISSLEKNGVKYESGPSAILLSDVLVQNGRFSNLAEFPVLQMLYRQGLILPGHPNNTGEKPILMGGKNQVNAQLEYIYRGNYGLISQAEIESAGVSSKQAAELMRMKLKFAFGSIRKTEELIDSRIIRKEPVEIKNGVFIERAGLNLFTFQYQDEKVTVDLGLKPYQVYEPPYELHHHDLKLEFFAVIHSGEGDGWDTTRPCMASILMFQGKIYLLDAGPNIEYSLRSLGIDISQIEGIFHTHAHDDHFAGIPTLVRADHRIKYYATPLVRSSVSKKLAALMSMEESKFEDYFEVHDLIFDEWNDVNGLEVKPMLSPHPVETNIFQFRAYWEDGYRTYAHYADIASLQNIQGWITENEAQIGITPQMYENVKNNYLAPVDIKKIDIGGEMIHGNAEDFSDDASGKIVLSHTSKKLSARQKEIGSETPFGTMDVLIPANQDYLRQQALNFLKAYLPMVRESELQSLTNCKIRPFNSGDILLKKGEVVRNVYLVLSGSVEYIRAESDFQYVLSTGSMIGDVSALKKIRLTETYRASSCIHTLEIPTSLYTMFAERNDLSEQIEHMNHKREFLQNTWLFGRNVSYPVQSEIIRKMELHNFTASQNVPVQEHFGLYLLEQGQFNLFSENQVIDTLGWGDFCGEDTVIFQMPSCFQVRAIRPSRAYFLPEEVLAHIPSVQWKLIEIFERRMGILVNYLLEKKMT
ncbi:cyclic nucleotide-binding domain-containing protein [Deltaproteobacteria bacterium TL4]